MNVQASGFMPFLERLPDAGDRGDFLCGPGLDCEADRLGTTQGETDGMPSQCISGTARTTCCITSPAMDGHPA